MPTYSFSCPRAPTLRGMGTAVSGSSPAYCAPRSNPSPLVACSPDWEKLIAPSIFPPPLCKPAGDTDTSNQQAATMESCCLPPGTLPRPTPASGDTGSRARSPGTKWKAQSQPLVHTKNTVTGAAPSGSNSDSPATTLSRFTGTGRCWVTCAPSWSAELSSPSAGQTPSPQGTKLAGPHMGHGE